MIIITMVNYLGLYLRLMSSALCLVFSWKVTNIDKLTFIQPQARGKMLLSLSYDPHRSLLKGIVLKAADLKKQDILGQAGS